MIKFPNAIAIRRNANVVLICVNSNNDTSHDGGNKTVTVMNNTAITIVTMNGTTVKFVYGICSTILNHWLAVGWTNTEDYGDHDVLIT